MDSKRRLKLGARIGNGAFGVVYKGTYDGHPVAIKTIAGGRCEDGDDLAFRMFAREAEILRQCSHSNIIGFKSMCRLTPHKATQGKWALVLEYAQGGTLSEKVSGQMIHPGSKVYSNKDALRWCLDLAHALQYLHQLSPAVMHRDVKLGNVVLAKEDGQWVAKLSDFGLHVVVDGARDRILRVTSSSGSIKPAYLTPRMILASAASKSAAVVSSNDSRGSEDIKAVLITAEVKDGDASSSSGGGSSSDGIKQQQEGHQQHVELQQTTALTDRKGPIRRVSFNVLETQQQQNQKQQHKPPVRAATFNCGPPAPATATAAASDADCYAARACDQPLLLNGSGCRRHRSIGELDDDRSFSWSVISDGTWISDGTCMTSSTDANRLAGSDWGGEEEPDDNTAGYELAEVETLYNMTGQTGSCMYMAPEVFLGQPYNEKADVFSFGVVLYEMMARCLLIFSELPTTTSDIAETERYAAKVAQGYRPARPKHMSQGVWQLVEACWQQEPKNRPSMAEVVSTLHSLLQSELESTAASKRMSFLSSTSAASQHSSSSAKGTTAAAVPAAAGAAAGSEECAAAMDSPEAPPGCGCVIC